MKGGFLFLLPFDKVFRMVDSLRLLFKQVQPASDQTGEIKESSRIVELFLLHSLRKSMEHGGPSKMSNEQVNRYCSDLARNKENHIGGKRYDILDTFRGYKRDCR